MNSRPVRIVRRLPARPELDERRADDALRLFAAMLARAAIDCTWIGGGRDELARASRLGPGRSLSAIARLVRLGVVEPARDEHGRAWAWALPFRSTIAIAGVGDAAGDA